MPTRPIQTRLRRSVIKPTVYFLAIALMSACTSTPSANIHVKPYSSLFGDTATCELGQLCDYTGEFKRRAATNPAIPDALYTYDDDHKCVLIVTDQNGLESFDQELEDVNFSGEEISITGQAVTRSNLDYWSTSSFCNDSEIAIRLKTVDAVIVMYHER